MEIDDLEAFLLVAKHGNLTQAAQQLGLTQPGLSRQMKRIEQRLGVVLFTRTHAGVELTPAGHRYRAYARDVLQRHRRLLEELRGVDSPVMGELRIAASTTPAEFVVPRLVSEFTARYPEVKAIISTTDSEGVVDDLLDGRWDVGFVGARLTRNRLRYDPIAEDEIVLAVPAHHPFAERGEVLLDELAGERFVEREGGSGTLVSVRRALAKHGRRLPPYRVSMTLTTTHAIVSAVRAGYGFGFVSVLALADQADGQVAAVRLAGVRLHRKLYLVTSKARVLPPVALRFVKHVLEHADSSGQPIGVGVGE